MVKKEDDKSGVKTEAETKTEDDKLDNITVTPAVASK